MAPYDNYWELPPGVKLSARRHQIYHDARKAAASTSHGDPILVLKDWPGATQADKRAVAWALVGADKAVKLFPTRVEDPAARRKTLDAGNAAVGLAKAASPEGITGTANRTHGDDLRGAAFVLGVGYALETDRSVDTIRRILVRRLTRSLDECGTSKAKRQKRYRRLMHRIGVRAPLLHATRDAMAAGQA